MYGNGAGSSKRWRYVFQQPVARMKFPAATSWKPRWMEAQFSGLTLAWRQLRPVGPDFGRSSNRVKKLLNELKITRAQDFSKQIAGFSSSDRLKLGRYSSVRIPSEDHQACLMCLAVPVFGRAVVAFISGLHPIPGCFFSIPNHRPEHLAVQTLPEQDGWSCTAFFYSAQQTRQYWIDQNRSQKNENMWRSIG